MGLLNNLSKKKNPQILIWEKGRRRYELPPNSKLILLQFRAFKKMET